MRPIMLVRAGPMRKGSAPMAEGCSALRRTASATAPWAIIAARARLADISCNDFS